MKKLIICLFFVLGLFFIMPMPVQAASYDLWVGGIPVTDENKEDVTGPGITSGTVTYDPSSQVLTLNNAVITGVYSDNEAYRVGNTYGIYFRNNDLTINLVGDSSITVPANSGHNSTGICPRWSNTGVLAIQGDGTLTVSVGASERNTGISGGNGSVIIGGDATVTVTAEPSQYSNYGIFCGIQGGMETYPITIQDNARLTVEVTAGAGGGSGLCSNGNILITDQAQVSATVLGTSTSSNGNGKSTGIEPRKLTISHQAVVTAIGGATAGTYSRSSGVDASTVEVLGSAQLTAAGGNTSGEGSNSCGVYVYVSATISDTAEVTATGGTSAPGKSYGIGGDDDYKIQITGGTVHAQGGTQAFHMLPVDGSNIPLVIPGWDGTALVTYPPVPTYSIEFNQSGTHVFPAQDTGYGTQTPLTVTVTNTGNQAAENLTVALSGANADSYSLSSSAIASLGVAGADSFTVVPVDGLEDGTYTATVTVSGDNGISASFDVSFTVSRRSVGSNNNSHTSTGSSFRALSDRATGIRAEGRLSGDIEVKSLVEVETGEANEVVDPETFNELKITVDNGYTVIGAYEVKLTNYKESLTLTFPVDDKHNGKRYVVRHRTATGKIVSYTGTVENGKITIQVTELSPFMLAILDSKATPDAKVNPFTDVKESDWFYNTVLWNHDMGLLQGTSATTFSPNTPMTRGMFAAVLARVDGADLSGFTGTKFTDVDMSKYYGPSVAWASENGIIAGYGNKLFGAEDRITREQMAAMLANYIRIKNIDISAVQSETVHYADDSQISPWAKDSVYIMQIHGLMGGRPGNLYGPKSIASRAEVAQVFLNYANAAK